MRAVCTSLVLVLLTATAGLASGFVTIAGEAELPWPDGWYLGSDSLNYPFQLVFHNDSAEVLVYKSRVTPDEQIRDHVELKNAVDLVVKDVIGSLPESQLYTSTGFYDTSRAEFVLEFKSADSITGLPVRHRLAGILYRTPSDGQLLFTVWGRAAAGAYDAVRPAMQMMQDGFAYHGDYEPTVFPPPRRNWWPAVLISLGVAGLVFVHLRRRHRRQPAGAPSTHFWTCECGRLNHESNVSCHRCGRPRA